MPEKRPAGSRLVSNPFIKKRNLEWRLETSDRDGHKDHLSHAGAEGDGAAPKLELDEEPTASAVEAGKAEIDDHVGYFSDLLKKRTLSPYPLDHAHLSVPEYRKLYEENFGNPNGAHFVIHQHDHPVAGTHYDLRLQINETSSASWAIMYGLPGDPDSKRLNRNATETRIHCLWNHLIETASHSTGSLMIWDTGTYTILPRRSKHAPRLDPNSQESEVSAPDTATEQEKLHRAFQNRKIHIRLNGTRLPRNYVLNLRLTKGEDAAGRARSLRQPGTRRRRGGQRPKAPEPQTSSDEDSYEDSEEDVAENADMDDDEDGKDDDEDEDDDDNEDDDEGEDNGNEKEDSTAAMTHDGDDEIVQAPAEANQEELSAMERELRELEDDEIRRTNAYTGATNSIGSVHQRRWYLSIERRASGLVKRTRRGWTTWERPEDRQAGSQQRPGFPFYVLGRNAERSVVTGRSASEILRDEGVVGFVYRQGWLPVLN